MVYGGLCQTRWFHYTLSPLSCQAVADKCVQQMQQAGFLSLRLCPKAKPPPSTEGGKRCAGLKEVRKRYWKREGQGPPYGVRGGRADAQWASLRVRRGKAGGQWGVTRPPPVAEQGRGASGSGRRETKVRQHQGYSPGTATGRPYEGVIDLIRRCAPPSPEGKVLGAGDRPYGCEGSIGGDCHALFLAVFLTGNTQILLTFPENYAIIQRL